MVVNLPEGAIERWFDDNGIMRRGFIMPDGHAYMIDSKGICVEVNTGSTNQQQVNQNGGANPVVTRQNKQTTYDTPALILGTILLIAGIYFAYTGYQEQLNLNSALGQLAHAFAGTTQQAKNDAELKLYGGIGGIVIGLVLLFFSEKKN